MSVNIGLIRARLPLMTLALCFALVSAAATFGQAVKGSVEGADPRQRIVARGRLIGTRELQQVAVWQTAGTAHLAVETVDARPRLLWQIDGRNSEYQVDSVRIADLDADGFPEILSLWWKRSSAVLRVFHWDRSHQSFAELIPENEIDRVGSYRIERGTGGSSSSRIVVGARSEPRSRPTARVYELRGSKLIRVGGGLDVTTKGESGIQGQAVISPAHPGPLRAGLPNAAPYKTTLVVWNAGDGREVARVETGSDGRFRVVLSPGTYRVGPPQQTGRFLPRGSEETVTVQPGEFVQVTITFDSGMR